MVEERLVPFILSSVLDVTFVYVCVCADVFQVVQPLLWPRNVQVYPPSPDDCWGWLPVTFDHKNEEMNVKSTCC